MPLYDSENSSLKMETTFETNTIKTTHHSASRTRGMCTYPESSQVSSTLFKFPFIAGKVWDELISFLGLFCSQVWFLGWLVCWLVGWPHPRHEQPQLDLELP